MDITYTWNIISVRKGTINGVENAIAGINWSLSGVCDDGCSGILYGYTELDPIDPTDFIEWEDLTKEQLIAWLEFTTNSNGQRVAFESNVQLQISEQRNQIVEVTEFPWSS